MSQQPFDYTGRDYLAIRDQLVSYLQSRVPQWSADASDFGYVLLEAMAGMGDMLSYYVDLAAQESNILSANSPANVFAFAELMGYRPGLAQSASVSILLFNSSPNQVVEVPIGGRVMDPVTNIGFEIIGPADQGNTVTVRPQQTVEVDAIEGFTRGPVEIGISDGEPGQRMPLPLDRGMYLDGRSIYVTTLDEYSRLSWDRSTTLMDVGPEDLAFAVGTDSRGNAYVQFGDGTYGAVPPKGQRVVVTYRQTSGAAGNAVLANAIKVWDTIDGGASVGGVGLLQVRNPNSPVGGLDPESTDSVRTQAVRFSKAQFRAVTADDFSRVARSDVGVQSAWSDYRVWTRPVVWVLPRDESLLRPATDTAKQEASDLLFRVTREVSSKALVGVAPTVLYGSVAPVKLHIEARVWEPVDLRRAANEIRMAVIRAFSYDDAQFDKDIVDDDVLRMIRDWVPDSMVRFAKVSLMDPVDPEQADDINSLPQSQTEYPVAPVLGLRPRPGNALVVREQDLQIAVFRAGTSFLWKGDQNG